MMKRLDDDVPPGSWKFTIVLKHTVANPRLHDPVSASLWSLIVSFTPVFMILDTYDRDVKSILPATHLFCIYGDNWFQSVKEERPPGLYSAYMQGI